MTKPAIPSSRILASHIPAPRVLGCDVAKDSITLFDTAVARPETVDNSPQALKALFKRLESDVFVVCEATGGYEAALLAAAHDAGLPIHRADPRKAKAFVRSLRTYGKTDALDARALAAYGLERHHSLTLWQPMPQALQDLQKLVRLRTDLIQARADYKRRLKAPGDGPDKRHIKTLINDLDQRIKDVEADSETCLAQQPQTTQITQTIEAIPGCGRVTAITLAALMPELGQLSNRQAASLAGLAPHPNDTGKANRYRATRPGRQSVKTAMFMAVMTATQHNPLIKAKYKAFIENGKKPIVALIACARKLITIINAKIRDQIYKTQKQLS